jgi:hypothetical protein
MGCCIVVQNPKSLARTQLSFGLFAAFARGDYRRMLDSCACCPSGSHEASGRSGGPEAANNRDDHRPVTVDRREQARMVLAAPTSPCLCACGAQARTVQGELCARGCFTATSQLRECSPVNCCGVDRAVASSTVQRSAPIARGRATFHRPLGNALTALPVETRDATLSLLLVEPEFHP